ncbi:hypothetical protein ANN_04803 [Periplaneta americana]|uniref:Uncharacterized protein n=1 Tax=Periplaneta americana TaxID=6978 RepID=A0ABQ8TA82_PERAM|nr:hypothetical protein ANN_04803 [Periplaneta americana]
MNVTLLVAKIDGRADNRHGGWHTEKQVGRWTSQKAWVDITARLEKPTYYGRNDHDFKIKCRKQKTDVVKRVQLVDLREEGYDDTDWINLAQDRDRWWAYERAIMNLWIPQKPVSNPDTPLCSSCATRRIIIKACSPDTPLHVQHVRSSVPTMILKSLRNVPRWRVSRVERDEA